jgi:hypothetical protein
MSGGGVSLVREPQDGTKTCGASPLDDPVVDRDELRSLSGKQLVGDDPAHPVRFL